MLTPKGEEQAERLRPMLARWKFSTVLCSPMQRARHTAHLAGYAEHAIIDRDLEEWDYGAYDGMTLAEIRAERPGWLLWRDGPKGGETLAAVAQRADHVIGRLREVDGDVLVVAHGHILRVITARWIQLSPEAGQRFVLGPASVSVLGYEHEWTVVRSWNQENG